MKIMMTVAGEAISTEAEAVVRAAIRGDAGVTELSPAEAVHCLAGVTLPAGWDWLAKVTDDSETLWQHGHLLARPLIGGEAGDGALREALALLAAEFETTAAENAKLADTASDGRTALRASHYAYQQCAEMLRGLLAGGGQ